MTNLQILIDTLEKKKAVLSDILRLTQDQENALAAEKPDMDAFDRAVQGKNDRIRDLEKLDVGFDRIFSKVRDELIGNKTIYANEIRRMQELIRETMDQGAEIHNKEQRNKKTIEQAFVKSRSQIRQNRTTSKAAYDYYKAMTSSPMGDPHFMDHKN